MFFSREIRLTISKLLKQFFFPYQPVSRLFGCDRGSPIDRFYIEEFLRKNRNLIRGDILEIAENTYTTKFANSPYCSNILHAEAGNPQATIVGNLETGENIPQNAYDCIILTQTLPFIYDIKNAVKYCRQALKSGGYILATVNGISQISRYDSDRWGDYWRFTEQSARRLFEDEFGVGKVNIAVYGNYYAAKCFLSGLAQEDINLKHLNKVDPDYPLIIGILAIK